MSAPPTRTLLFGLTDTGQAEEAAAVGVDGVVLDLRPDAPAGLDPERAVAVAAALPPLVSIWALVPAHGAVTPRHAGAVVELGNTPPAGAARVIARVPMEIGVVERLEHACDALWVRPRPAGSATASRYDFRTLERWARRHRLVLEVPEGAPGVEVAVRLARPYALVLAEGVWFRPGIVDIEEVERALGVVARLNRRAVG
jgi:hypothetical protein